MKKVLISGNGRVEKVNLLEILNSDDVKTQSCAPKTKKEQFRIKAEQQIKSQTDQHALDIEQERSF